MNICIQIKAKPRLMTRHLLFQEEQHFHDLIELMRPLWNQPRNGGTRYRARKHPIEASLIGTLSILRLGYTLSDAEALCGIDKSLIYIDLHRNCEILATVLDSEMEWPSHEEQLILIGVNDEFDSCIIIDAMDIKLKTTTDWLRYIYSSWKTGAAYRNLLAVDSKGEIRNS